LTPNISKNRLHNNRYLCRFRSTQGRGIQKWSENWNRK